MANIGKVTQVIGPVVDVRFDIEGAKLPNILDALELLARLEAITLPNTSY